MLAIGQGVFCVLYCNSLKRKFIKKKKLYNFIRNAHNNGFYSFIQKLCYIESINCHAHLFNDFEHYFEY